MQIIVTINVPDDIHPLGRYKLIRDAAKWVHDVIPMRVAQGRFNPAGLKLRSDDPDDVDAYVEIKR